MTGRFLVTLRLGSIGRDQCTRSYCKIFNLRIKESSAKKYFCIDLIHFHNFQTFIPDCHYWEELRKKQTQVEIISLLWSRPEKKWYRKWQVLFDSNIQDNSVWKKCSLRVCSIAERVSLTSHRHCYDYDLLDPAVGRYCRVMEYPGGPRH